MVLTGQDSHLADAVEDLLRELYAIKQIHERLKPGDTLFEEARDRLEESEERFAKALSAAYNRIYFPSLGETDSCETLVSVTIDNGLKLGSGRPVSRGSNRKPPCKPACQLQASDGSQRQIQRLLFYGRD